MVHIVSCTHQRKLACDEAGRLSTSYQGNAEWQSWRLEPCLPFSMSSKNIVAISTAGAVGLALTVAMPFAVVGAVEAVGLTATEIAAGFTAEAMVGLGGGALIGAGVVGKTAMSLNQDQRPAGGGNGHDRKASNEHQPPQYVSPMLEANEGITSHSLRPLSAWRNWSDDI